MAKSEVQNFIEQNELMTVEVSPGVSYDMRSVINENYRLYNRQFEIRRI